jgi:hypothetical protein
MAATVTRRARLALLGTVALVTALLPLLMAGFVAVPTGASSHREAPLIAEDPLADGTDVYAFVSPDNTNTVTLVANYVPFQLPSGGPNFYRFGDDVLYKIHVDNNGDAAEDIVFEFRFTTATLNGDTFLYNTGPITFENGQYKNWNRPQTYSLTVVKNGVSTELASNLLSPPNNIGPRSTPDYPALANAAIATNVGGLGIRSFAGQRDDPFFVDLGRAFDLLGVNPAGGADYVGGLSVNSLVLQVPKTYLQGIDASDPVIGVWSTASRQTTSVLDGNGNKNTSGGFTQVSRLGMPLVNEVVVPLAAKDLFNATELTPTSDGPFLPKVLEPELAALFVALGIDPNTPTTDRQDLVTVFLTGVPGLNQPKNTAGGGVVPAEMIRLNMSIAPSTNDPNTVNRMGVLGGQLDGFPNGRRLADDVTDIELLAVAGILCQTGGPLAGNSPCRTTPVNPALGDGVPANDLPFQTTFPYLANPRPPYGSGATPPSVPSFSVTVETVGNGTVTPGTGTYGGIVDFTAVPAAGNLFIGWTVDGQFVGLKNPLKLGISKNRTVRAEFAPRAGFGDLPSNDPAAEAVAQLAARGFVRGTSPTTFEPTNPVLRAQAAALVGRTLGYTPQPPGSNPFPDRCDAQGQACIDDELWGFVATLAANGIARGWDDQMTCASIGTTSPCYIPRDPVARIQMISFITRAFVDRGYWTRATVDTGIYPNVPSNSSDPTKDQRLDLVTFVNNTGLLPDLTTSNTLPSNGNFPGYDQQASRAYAARLLWQAYSAYYSVNRIPFP